MDDLFARVGSVLETLLNQSTLSGDVKTEGLRLAAELQSAPVDIAALIEDRVRAAVEQFDGRVAAAEDAIRVTRTTLFDTTTVAALDAALEHRPEAREKLGELFSNPPGEVAPTPEVIVEEPAGEATEAGAADTAPDVFNGAPAEAFDHDGDGAPGGSKPAPASDEIEGMTVAQLKNTLDGFEIGYPADAKKPELQAILRKAMAGAGDDTQSGS